MRQTATLTISLPPPLLQKARQFAERESRTLSELMRESLRRYVGGSWVSEPLLGCRGRRVAKRKTLKGLDRLVGIDKALAVEPEKKGLLAVLEKKFKD